jgi:hypothetical protein
MNPLSFNRNETCSLHDIAKTNAQLVKAGTLDKTGGTITNGQSTELATLDTQEDKKKHKKQHNMCWTPLHASKHK